MQILIKDMKLEISLIWKENAKQVLLIILKKMIDFIVSFFIWLL